MLRYAFFLLSTLMLVPTGCSKPSPSANPTDVVSKATPNKQADTRKADPASKASAAASASKKKGFKSIVTLGGSVTETVFALGHGSKVVGVDVSSVYPPNVNQLPKVGYYRRVSAEGIISLSPDLVLASSASGPKDVLKKITDVGIRLEIVPAAKTLDAAKARITSIAKLFGSQAKGKELLQSLDTKIKSVKAATPAKKVLFIYARGAGSLSVAGTKTAADEMIRLAGGVNVVKDYEGYKPINSESIVAAAPDVILLTTRGLKSVGGADAVTKLKGIALTPAAKNKAIIAVDDLLLLGFGPRTGDAVADLAAKLTAAP